MKLYFGKYKGKELQDIACSDPQYVLWLARKQVLKVPQNILDLALKKGVEKDEADKALALNFLNYHRDRDTLEYRLRGNDIENWYDKNGL